MSAGLNEGENGMLCPKCGKEMEVVVIDGVAIDKCGDHGLWFDRGEYEKLNSTKWRKQHRMIRLASDRAKRDGKMQGALLGWLSLFFD
jgi:Zn-finger nucleic acid-binding protein